MTYAKVYFCAAFEKEYSGGKDDCPFCEGHDFYYPEWHYDMRKAGRRMPMNEREMFTAWIKAGLHFNEKNPLSVEEIARQGFLAGVDANKRAEKIRKELRIKKNTERSYIKKEVL